MAQKLPRAFFLREDVVHIARELLGKILVTRVDGLYTAGRITETEAYRAPDDRACHAWNNRRTPRTEVMFWEGGKAYVYLCYGLHHLFNVVTGPEGTAHAVLIRKIDPLEGIETMLQRRKKTRTGKGFVDGPGSVGQALGLHTRFSGTDFYCPDAFIWIETDGFTPEQIYAGKRIGVEYAGDCAERPWRFWT